MVPLGLLVEQLITFILDKLGRSTEVEEATDGGTLKQEPSVLSQTTKAADLFQLTTIDHLHSVERRIVRGGV